MQSFVVNKQISNAYSLSVNRIKVLLSVSHPAGKRRPLIFSMISIRRMSFVDSTFFSGIADPTKIRPAIPEQ
jgi:hypothetical protein